MEVSKTNFFEFLKSNYKKCLNLNRDNGLAERVFNSMEPKTAEAYCALVCGMANYGQVEGAWVYYQQMQSKIFKQNFR